MFQFVKPLPTPVVRKPVPYGPCEYPWKDRNHYALKKIFDTKSSGDNKEQPKNFAWVSENDLVLDALDEFLEDHGSEALQRSFITTLPRPMRLFVAR